MSREQWIRAAFSYMIQHISPPKPGCRGFWEQRYDQREQGLIRKHLWDSDDRQRWERWRKGVHSIFPPPKKKNESVEEYTRQVGEIRGERMKRGGMSNWDNDQQWWGGTWSARGQRKGRHFATLSRQGDLRERRRKWKNLINEIISQSTSITLHRRTRRRFQAG